MSAIDVVLGRFAGVKPHGKGWMVQCPAHDDRHASLKVDVDADGRVLLHCFAGCTVEKIVDAIGLSLPDLFDHDESQNGGRQIVDTYDYVDESGAIVFQVVRFAPKDFRQRRPDGNGGWVWNLRAVPRPLPLYGLPDVLAAVRDGRAVWIVEGERHADLLRSRGRVATTSAMGAGKWNRAYADTLAGAARVFVLPDDDEVGRVHAEQIAQSLQGRVTEIKIVSLFPTGETKRDVVDFYREHETREAADRALVEIVESTPPYVPGETQTINEPSSAGERLRPTSNGSMRRGRLTRLSDVTAKRVEWVVPEMIARGNADRTRLPWRHGEGAVRHPRVDEARSTRARRRSSSAPKTRSTTSCARALRLLAATPTLAYALSIDDDGGDRVPHFPSDLPLLRQAIEEVVPQLVIVDPIASYIDPGLDMSKNNEMRLILQPLIELAHDAHVAILVVYHHGKQRDRGALGTVGFEDACRLVLSAARDDEDEDVRHVELTKSNISATGYGRKYRIVGVPLDIDDEIVEVAKLVDEGRSGKSVQALLAIKGAPGPEPEKRRTCPRRSDRSARRRRDQGRQRRCRQARDREGRRRVEARPSGAPSPNSRTKSLPSPPRRGTSSARSASGAGSRKQHFYSGETMRSQISPRVQRTWNLVFNPQDFKTLCTRARARARESGVPATCREIWLRRPDRQRVTAVAVEIAAPAVSPIDEGSTS